MPFARRWWHQDVGTAPGHAAGGGGLARSSPRHVPNPHHTKTLLWMLCHWDPPLFPDFRHDDLCAFAHIDKISKRGCESKLAPGVWLFSLPFAGNAKGLQSGHQTQFCFPAGGTAGNRGQSRTQGTESHVWVSRGAGQDCGSQQTHAFLTAKSPWGLEMDQVLWQIPGATRSQNAGGICWPGSGFAMMKRFQWPQGEKEKKKKRKGKGGHA